MPLHPFFLHPSPLSVSPRPLSYPSTCTCSYTSRMSLLPPIISARSRSDLSLLLSTLSEAHSNFQTYLSQASLFLTAATAVTLLSLSPTLAEIPTQPPQSALFDETGLIQRGNAQLIDKAASAMLRDDGVHVRFAFVKSLPYGETLSEYATELANGWNLEGKDVLFVASPKLARAGVYVGKDVGMLKEDVAISVAEETYGLKSGDEKYGSAWLDVCNRLIVVLGGGEDPGPPDLVAREVVQNFKTKKETEEGRGKYIKVVGGILVIAFLAPLVQTYWYVKDD